MKAVIINMSEMTDSREIMESKAPKTISVFILIVALILVSALAWTCFTEMDDYITVAGEIRPEETVATVTAQNGGIVTYVSCSDTHPVSAGDLLLEFNSTVQYERLEHIEEQIEDCNQKISYMETLKQSIKKNKNLFSKADADESYYYYKYETYKYEYNNTYGKKGKNNVKNRYYVEIDSAIEEYRAQINSLESELLTITESIANSKIYAHNDGVIMINNDISVGDYIAAGTTVASIMPLSKDICAIIYVPSSQIGSVAVGQDVEFTFDCYSLTDYGTIHGVIQKISVDSIVDESSGKRYYQVEASFDSATITSHSGKTGELMVGMEYEARIISGSQKTILWLLDMLNLRD